MGALYKKFNLARILIILTALIIILQISIISINLYVTGMLDIMRAAITSELFFSEAVYPHMLGFVAAQLFIYILFIYLLWFVSVSVAEMFYLGPRSRYFFGIFMWFSFVIAITTLSLFLVPHSLFTTIIRHNLFADILSDHDLKITLIISGSICAAAIVFTLLNMLFNVFMLRHLFRTAVMVSILLVSLFFLQKFYAPQNVPKNENAAYNLPNIFIIGFDALRPDYLSFYDISHRPTPHFDEFLRSSVVFEDAYTTAARTMPSWMSILTAKYPIHNGIRENNTYLGASYNDETLPKLLQKAGYETIYATDDRRFNLIDRRVGFDQVIGPKGTVADYLIGSLNDFPLSNLIVVTPLGKLLFPYSYANHGPSQSYDPDNFLEQLNHLLQPAKDKPIFLAVHFNLSGWPFFWFNDKAPYYVDSVYSYINAIPGDDKLLGKFLDLLEKKNFLKRAIVILISDHGMTLAKPGDRIITEALFQGDKLNMKVMRTRYSDADTVHLDPNKMTGQGNNVKLTLHKNMESIFDRKNYGVDTSFGYGGDVLSLKQHRSLMAFKGFGFDIGQSHQVYGPSLLLDIAPTILDLLQLPTFKKSDGISLKPYLNSPFLELSRARPIFLESTYSFNAIEQRDIAVAKVLEESIYQFSINPKTGLVLLNPELIKFVIDSKQRAIMLGDWLLAYYPISERFKFIFDKQINNYQIHGYLLAPYFVLVNLKTGKWTTEINNTLVANSPFSKLKQSLFQFYGHEMDVYFKKK